MFNNSKKDTVYVNLSASEFKTKMSEPETVVLDVRTAQEVDAGYIPDARVEMDYKSGEFAEKVKNLDTSKTYLVYCRSGVRSAYACEYLAAHGFTKLYNLRGGILEWNSVHD
jgi:thioredoxin 1